MTVGETLIVIGSTLTILSVAMLMIGALYRKEVIQKVYNEKVSFEPREPKATGKEIGYVFTAKYPSRLRLELNTRLGPFHFQILELPNFPPLSTAKEGRAVEEFWEFPKIFEKRIDSGTFVDEFKIEEGVYAINFYTEYARVECDLKAHLVYENKPLEKLVDHGMTLLTIAIPILVTGAVILSGASFAV